MLKWRPGLPLLVLFALALKRIFEPEQALAKH
jgi:hypothetical protein